MESLDFVLRSNAQTPWRLDLPFRIESIQSRHPANGPREAIGQQFEASGSCLLILVSRLFRLKNTHNNGLNINVSPTTGAISFGAGETNTPTMATTPIPTQIPQNFMALILMSACSKIACRFPICEKISSKTLRESSNLPVNREVFAASAFAAPRPPLAVRAESRSSAKLDSSPRMRIATPPTAAATQSPAEGQR